MINYLRVLSLKSEWYSYKLISESAKSIGPNVALYSYTSCCLSTDTYFFYMVSPSSVFQRCWWTKFDKKKIFLLPIQRIICPEFESKFWCSPTFLRTERRFLFDVIIATQNVLRFNEFSFKNNSRVKNPLLSQSL